MDQDCQALLDHETRIKNDQAKAQGQNIIASPHFEKVSDSLLWKNQSRCHVSFVLHPILIEQCVDEETYQAQPLIAVNSALRLALFSIRHLGWVWMRLAPGAAQVRRRCNESRRLMSFVSRQASHSGFWTGFERSKASSDYSQALLRITALPTGLACLGCLGNLFLLGESKGGPVGPLFNPIGLSESILQNCTRWPVC